MNRAGPARHGWRCLARLYDWVFFAIAIVLLQVGIEFLGLSIGLTLHELTSIDSGEHLGFFREYFGFMGPRVPNHPLLESEEPFTQFWAKTMFVVPMVLVFLYEIPLVALSGRTVGKMMARLKVVNVENGQLPGWKRSTLRWLVLYGPMLIPIIGWILVLLIYFVSTTLDKNRRPLHDRIAGTTVIRQDRGPEEPSG